MMEINNLTKFKIDRKSFAQVAKKVLKGENKGTQNISLAFVDKTEMQKLNKKFRKKDKPTDVLSFSFDEKDFLGEIVICPEVVKKKKENIKKVFVHGILHLLGYDHKKSKTEEIKMQNKEKFYFNEG